jgi:hypothetical protein
VFRVNRDRFRVRLTEVFTAEGSTPTAAACLADGIVADGSDAVLVYARLGVQRPEYVELRERIEADCV